MDIPTYYSSNGVYRGHDFKTWREEEIEGNPVADPEAYNQNIPDISGETAAAMAYGPTLQILDSDTTALTCHFLPILYVARKK